MGTPAKTRIYDEENNLLISFYRQSDGHPKSHGEELKRFCANFKIVNGLRDSDPAKVANGMGDFAAQCLAHFKCQYPIGGIYVLSPKTEKEWVCDFTYTITFDDGKIALRTFRCWPFSFSVTNKNNMSHKLVKFRIRKSKDQQFFFAILAPNNKTLAHSETYHRIQGVHKALKSLILGLQLDGARIQRLDDKHVQIVPHFELNKFLDLK